MKYVSVQHLKELCDQKPDHLIGKQDIDNLDYVEITFSENAPLKYCWNGFHDMPFEVRKAVREFWKHGKDYSDESEVWKEKMPEDIDKKEFVKAVQVYDYLLSFNKI